MNANANLATASAVRPTPASSTHRRVIALTDDPALSQALETLATLNVTVVQVATRESLAEEILRGPPATAIIDAACADRQIDSLVDQLTAQFPDLRIVAAGHSLEQNVLATRIAQGVVFRFLHKPASAQRLKLFVDAADRPSDITRSVPILTAVAEPAREPARQAAGPEGPRRGPTALPMPLLLGAAAAIVLAGGGWLLFSGDGARTRPAVSSPAPASADVESLIRSADQAFAAQRFAGTTGDSAAELYQRALLSAPQDSRARSGLTRSFDFALRDAETAFNEGRHADVDSAIAALRVISPGNSRLAFLSTQLTRERERSAAEDGRRTNVEARQASEGEARAVRERMAARLVENVNQKLEAGDPAAARTLLDAAAGMGVDAATLARLRQRAEEMSADSRDQRVAVSATATATATAPVPAAAALEPAPSAAAAAPTSGPRFYANSELTLLKKVEPEYPKRALDLGTSGWVDVEFTVSIDGSVKNVVVLASEPGNMFDAAAQQGLRKWRYRPVVENGDVVEARARMRLRFTPQGR